MVTGAHVHGSRTYGRYLPAPHQLCRLYPGKIRKALYRLSLLRPWLARGFLYQKDAIFSGEIRVEAGDYFI